MSEIADELRRILEPLLDAPIPDQITRCVFCQSRIYDDNPWSDPYDPKYHEPDCPVLAKDRLPRHIDLHAAPEPDQPVVDMHAFNPDAREP